jgi:hypothetical protein
MVIIIKPHVSLLAQDAIAAFAPGIYVVFIEVIKFRRIIHRFGGKLEKMDRSRTEGAMTTT